MPFHLLTRIQKIILLVSVAILVLAGFLLWNSPNRHDQKIIDAVRDYISSLGETAQNCRAPYIDRITDADKFEDVLKFLNDVELVPQEIVELRQMTLQIKNDRHFAQPFLAVEKEVTCTDSLFVDAVGKLARNDEWKDKQKQTLNAVIVLKLKSLLTIEGMTPVSEVIRGLTMMVENKLLKENETQLKDLQTRFNAFSAKPLTEETAIGKQLVIQDRDKARPFREELLKLLETL